MLKSLIKCLCLIICLGSCASNWQAADRNIESAENLFKEYFKTYGNAFYLSTSTSRNPGYEYVWTLQKDHIIFSSVNHLGKVKTETRSGKFDWLERADCDFAYPDCNRLLEGDIISIAYSCDGSDYFFEEVFEEFCFRRSKDFFVRNVWEDMRRLKLFL